eukprot:8089908-Prorocentrum_lima.AAC.1
MKEAGTNETWKAKTGMVICGKFATENAALCDSTFTHNIDFGLLRIMLSMSHGNNGTLTTTGIANT